MKRSHSADFEADVVRLHDDEGLSWNEIGEKLGEKKEACRSAYRREDTRRRGRVGRPPASVSAKARCITGIVPADDIVPVDELWREAIDRQGKTAKRIAKKRLGQRVAIPANGKPFAIAMLSDVHFGNPGTDYVSVKRDAEIIQATEGMYAIYHGDGLSNWIMSKLMHLQRNQVLELDGEIQLFSAWLTTLSGSLVAAVSGNHDNWTYLLSGIDIVRRALEGVRCLYDRNEVVFDLAYGKVTKTLKVRHAWKYGSVFNVTHGIEVGWERGGDEFDIGLGGHTHIATVCRPFYRHGIKRLAVLTGTYIVDDSYGRQLGLAKSVGSGCGAILFYPNGQMEFFDNLEICADFLTWLRNRKAGS